MLYWCIVLCCILSYTMGLKSRFQYISYLVNFAVKGDGVGRNIVILFVFENDWLLSAKPLLSFRNSFRMYQTDRQKTDGQNCYTCRLLIQSYSDATLPLNLPSCQNNMKYTSNEPTLYRQPIKIANVRKVPEIRGDFARLYLKNGKSYEKSHRLQGNTIGHSAFDTLLRLAV